MIIFIKISITRIFTQLLLQQNMYLNCVDIYNTEAQLIFTFGIYQVSISTAYFYLTETELKLHINM
jgi:hypothetical protein